MAIRFQNAIDNSVAAVQNSMDVKVKNAQEEMQRLLDKVMKHKDDMIDVIDTWLYIKAQGLSKYFNEDLLCAHERVGAIYVYQSTIEMRFNNWKKEGGGPYDWYVMFDGEDVKIYINDKDEMATVKDMISRAVYDKQKDYVVMPIFNTKYSYYVTHDYSIPMKALAYFADNIEDYCTNFFNEAQNITLK